jgi:hypothetical protein
MDRAQNHGRTVIRAGSPPAGTFRVLMGVCRPRILAGKHLSLATLPFPRTGSVIGAPQSWNPSLFKADPINPYLRGWTMIKLPPHPHTISLTNV